MKFGASVTSLVCGLVFGVVSIASAGEVEPEPECSDIQEAVFAEYEELRAIDEQFSEEFGADPSISDCQDLCKMAVKSCRKTLHKKQDAERQDFGGDVKIAKRYCKTVDNEDEADQCKTEIKTMKGEQKKDQKADRAEIKQECEDNVVLHNCQTSCNQDIAAETCEDLFFTDIGAEEDPG